MITRRRKIAGKKTEKQALSPQAPLPALAQIGAEGGARQLPE